MDFFMLDIGCGGTPKGDVNCDLFIGRTPHADKDFIRKTAYFVRCDAQHLPFKDKSFCIIHSSHLIEHLPQPYDALREFKRVAKNIVYLRLPNSASVFKQRKEHVYAWDYNTFSNFLGLIFQRYEVHNSSVEVLHGRLTNRLWLVKRIITFILKRIIPDELTAICEVE